MVPITGGIDVGAAALRSFGPVDAFSDISPP